jgi:signal transduction histidine kinase
MARLSAQPSGYTILVVDDDEATLRSTRRLLDREGHRVLVASSGQNALGIFRREGPQLLVIDYFMPGMTGGELIGEIRREDDSVQILLQTGYAGEKPAQEMLEELDIQGYHDKSDGAERFLVWVRVCLKAHRQLQRVREAERLKSELLNNLSHEFRTPLNVSLGYLDMLTEGACGPLTSEARGTLNRITQNTAALVSLVNDLLDLAKLETQAAETRLEPLLLTSLRGDIVAGIELLPGEKAIPVRWDVPGNLPAVLADRAKLGLVLSQILSETAQKMPGGEIRVWTRAAPGTLALLIGCSGLALQRGRESEIAVTGEQDGKTARFSPLAFAVARRVSHKIGAELTIEYGPGDDPTFALTLPVAPTGAPEAADTPAVGG